MCSLKAIIVEDDEIDRDVAKSTLDEVISRWYNDALPESSFTAILN